MATKINQSVYGTVPTTTYSRAVCPNNIGTLYSAGNYDPSGDCENGFEKSISPWGIGGGMSLDVFVGNAQRSANGRFAKLNIDTPENYNKPVSFWDISITQGSQDNNKPQRYRIGGNLKYSSGSFLSNGSTENGLILWGANANTKPIGKIEYNHILLYPLSICLRGNENYSTPLTSWSAYDITQLENSHDFITDEVELSAFSWGCKMYNSYVGTPNSWHTEELSLINTKSQEVPEIYKAMSMRDSTDTSKWYDKAILSLPNVIGVFDDVTRMIPNTNCYSGNSYCKLASADFTSSTQQDYTRYGFGKCYGVGNTNKHVFDDISYHYEIKCFYLLNGVYREVLENELMLAQTMYFLPYFKIDETTYNTKWESIKAIIRHELAFIGFPFVMGYNQTGNIGDNNVSVPVFDAHMITTGNYVTGAASLQLSNAQWGDIFSDTMPEYDPNYNPPKPSSGESDGGFLNNSTYRAVKLAGSNEFYAMDVGELRSLMTFINGMYQGDPDDTQLKIDFKGSNPNDYIVGIYAYPFNIPNTAHLSNIYIGPVETNVNANVVDKDTFGFATFGSILVDGDALGFHGDFRDYEPYTQLELYLPMVGTAKLDPSYYVGHYVTVNYIYDINTGSLSAQILRDDTIDKIIESTISVQIPVTARDMGSYQNNIYQMKMNLLNTAVHGAASGITQTATAATKGTDLNGVTNAAVSGFEYGQQFGKTIYDMKHMQPAIAQTSTASPANGMQFYNNCVLFVKHLKMLDDFDPENYGKTVGYACLMNKQLSDVSGFTVCANADLSGIPATADEINAIQAALQSGIYL